MQRLNPRVDAPTALRGMMIPLGGLAETSGYKGYGLSAAIDLLTSGDVDPAVLLGADDAEAGR